MRWYARCLLALFLIAPIAHAQTNSTDSLENTQETEKAVVISVESSQIRTIPGTDTSQEYQTLSARVLEGSDAGKTIEVDNDYLALKPGDTFFLTHETNTDPNVDSY